MIIQTILHKTYFHPFLYVASFLCVITGYFKEFIIFMLFIMVHEMGHIVMALICGWNIEKVILLPFGGLTIFHEKIGRPLKEECVIALGGILFQSLFYFFISFFIWNETLATIHYGILFFNLIPIYPLDGSKLFNIICNYIFSFKRSHIYTLLISVILLCLFIGLSYENLFLDLVYLFLLIGLIKEIKNHKYLFHKFLLERYLEPVSFSKIKEIREQHPEKMKRDCKHIFWIGCKREKEHKILCDLFDNTRYMC